MWMGIPECLLSTESCISLREYSGGISTFNITRPLGPLMNTAVEWQWTASCPSRLSVELYARCFLCLAYFIMPRAYTVCSITFGTLFWGINSPEGLSRYPNAWCEAGIEGTPSEFSDCSLAVILRERMTRLYMNFLLSASGTLRGIDHSKVLHMFSWHGMLWRERGSRSKLSLENLVQLLR